MLDSACGKLGMARPLTAAQRHENTAFLTALRRTGNARLAARQCGLKYGTMQYRRAKHPALAQQWDAAVVFAHARLRQSGGAHGPTSAARDEAQALRTRGGEPVVILLKSGRLQLRRAQPGKVTRQAEQAFLLAVAATANIALAAASVGVAEAAFHRRKRQNPAFARELRAALAEGYERLEMALLESAWPESGDDAQWRDNERPAIPPMTAAQALQLMYLHQKEARLLAEPAHLRKRRGESGEARSYRLAAMWEVEREREREKFREAQAARRRDAEGDAGRHAPPPIVLPDLAQVTGWSKADPTKGGHGSAALFGGWRMGNLSEAQREEGRAKGQDVGRANGRKVRVLKAPEERKKPGRQILRGE